MRYIYRAQRIYLSVYLLQCYKFCTSPSIQYTGDSRHMRFKIIGVLVLISGTLCSALNFTSSNDSKLSARTLPRRKRYLNFPSGSILQLGYCVDIPLLIPNNLWLYGITFGTNWEIPTTPPGLKVQRDAEVVHRRQRRDLYQKLLPMLNTMELDGQSCILRALCESGQRPPGAKGSFLEEILHAIFTLKRSKTTSDDYDDDDFTEYDEAYGKKKNCADLFPSCLKDLDAS